MESALHASRCMKEGKAKDDRVKDLKDRIIAGGV
jgi:hypothetical protein